MYPKNGKIAKSAQETADKNAWNLDILVSDKTQRFVAPGLQHNITLP